MDGFEEESGFFFIVSGQQVILSRVVDNKIETLMEFTPKSSLNVPQKVIPIKGVSTSDYT